jgi:hypothetical protein
MPKIKNIVYLKLLVKNAAIHSFRKYIFNEKKSKEFFVGNFLRKAILKMSLK